MLIVDINGTSLALVNNDEILSHLVYRQNSCSYTQIKSRLTIYLKCYKFSRENIAARIFNWEIENPRAIKFLTGIGSKVSALHNIDKTRMLVYMAILGDDSVPKLLGKTAMWRNVYDLFMRQRIVRYARWSL